MSGQVEAIIVSISPEGEETLRAVVAGVEQHTLECVVLAGAGIAVCSIIVGVLLWATLTRSWK